MRLIELYDTRTKSLRPLTPLAGKQTLIYSCGPTLYQAAHIGNMRAYVFADTLNRTLRHFGYQPKHVINFTDVGHLTDDADAGEDKVEKQAAQENQSAEVITERFGNLFLADLKKLNIKTSRYIFPRATHHIQEQIELTQRLEQKGYTYDIEDARRRIVYVAVSLVGLVAVFGRRSCSSGDWLSERVMVAITASSSWGVCGSAAAVSAGVLSVSCGSSSISKSTAGSNSGGISPSSCWSGLLVADKNTSTLRIITMMTSVVMLSLNFFLMSIQYAVCHGLSTLC